MRNPFLLRLTIFSLLGLFLIGLIDIPGADAQVRRRRLPSAPQAARPKVQVITLESQETLHTLAEQYLGSKDDWRELQRLNRRTLLRRIRTNPDAPIPAGTRVVLPAGAVKMMVMTLDKEMTMRLLAREYLGSEAKWLELQRMNQRMLSRSVLENPDAAIPEGTKIMMPVSAMMAHARPTPAPTPRPVPVSTPPPAIGTPAPPPTLPPAPTPAPVEIATPAPPAPTPAPTPVPMEEIGLVLEGGTRAYGILTPNYGRAIGMGAKIGFNFDPLFKIPIGLTLGGYYMARVKSVSLGFILPVTQIAIPLEAYYQFDLGQGIYPYVYAVNDIIYASTFAEDGTVFSGFSLLNIGAGLGVRYYFFENFGVNVQLGLQYGIFGGAGFGVARDGAILTKALEVIPGLGIVGKF